MTVHLFVPNFPRNGIAYFDKRKVVNLTRIKNDLFSMAVFSFQMENFVVLKYYVMFLCLKSQQSQQEAE